jgi:hypothetical protein
MYNLWKPCLENILELLGLEYLPKFLEILDPVFCYLLPTTILILWLARVRSSTMQGSKIESLFFWLSLLPKASSEPFSNHPIIPCS